jgi:alanine dehydrogenase
VAQDVLWISEREVASLGITMEEVIEAVENGWRLKGEGKVEMPAKIGIHPRKNCYIHAMPCWIGGDVDTCGLKWVSGFPENLKKKMPYNIGLFILTDSDDGHMKAVMDANWITTWRTGAASGVIAKYLGPKDPSVVSIIGAGTQGRINLRAMMAVFPNLKAAKVYDPMGSQVEGLKAQMAGLFPALEVIPCADVRLACADADIVISCAPVLEKPERNIRSAWLKKDVLCIAVDHDSSFDADVMTEAAAYVVDDRGQYEHMQGGGVYFQGYPTEEELYAEMSEVVVGKKPQVREGRRGAAPMGIACNDVIVGKMVYERTLAKKAGTWVEP